MDKSLIDILSSLKNSTKIDDKKNNSKILEEKIFNITEKDNQLFYKTIERTLVKEIFKKYGNFLTKEFFDLTVKKYSYKQKDKIAIQISYLQNYPKAVNDLDHKILFLVENTITKNNLNLIINDLTVNTLQKINY